MNDKVGKIKLSFCIPTYNRAKCLSQCLASIIDDLGGDRERIEIVVSDNASSDNTRDVVAGAQRSFSNVKYHRNGNNVGFDKNLINAINFATGEYVFLLSDDDAVIPGSIKYVLDKLEEFGNSLYIFSYIGYDKDLKNITEKNFGAISIDIHKYKNLQQFVKGYNFYHPSDLVGLFGGMSGKVFKRSVWQDIDKEEFIGRDAIHLFAIVRGMKELKILSFDQPVFKARGENIRWETFPSINSERKRMDSSRRAFFWICDECDRKYNKTQITALLILGSWRANLFKFIKENIIKDRKKIEAIKAVLKL